MLSTRYYEFYLYRQLLNNIDKKIMFYGASQFLEDFLERYNLSQFDIIGIIDKNPSKQGQMLSNYRIYSPQILNDCVPLSLIFTIFNNNQAVYNDVKLGIKNPNVKLESNPFTDINNDINEINAINLENLNVRFLKCKQEYLDDMKELGEDYKRYSEMSEQERAFLYSLVREYKPKKLLELGVSKGGSAYIMLNAMERLNNKSHLHSVDYAEYNFTYKYKRNGFYLDKFPLLKKNWTLYTGGYSLNYLDKIASTVNEEDKIDFCFIDTSHKLPIEVFDFLQVLPYLKKDSVVVFHDTNLQVKWKECYCNNCLMSVITGEKIIPLPTKELPSWFGAYMSNIGAIHLNQNSFKNLFEIFNLLALRWEAMPKDDDINSFKEYLNNHYHPYYVKYFDDIVYLQKQYLQKKIDD